MIIIGIKIINRENLSIDLQDILTEFGCIIKTRLGLHDVCNNSCSDDGIILLEVINDEKSRDLINELSNLDNIEIQIMRFY